MATAAREKKVVTQLGNQGHSADDIRLFCEWIREGAIGNVTDSIAIIKNCMFLHNEANSGSTSFGGAIGNFGMSLTTVNQSVFVDNRAIGVGFGEKGFGGAIATRPGTVENSGSLTEVKNCQFRFNLARNSAASSEASAATTGGGALYNDRSELLIQRCDLLQMERWDQVEVSRSEVRCTPQVCWTTDL